MADLPNPILDDKLRKEYETLFAECEIKDEREAETGRIVNRMLASQARYEKVGNSLHIPWYFIGIIHSMECSANFNLHLHNGDLLSQRTLHVPKGRPVTGNPPFTWEASAADALTMKRLHLNTDWSLSSLLFIMEGYNGFGYRKYHPDVLTPYLWSFSNKYTQGKYASDGKFDPQLVSKQCGTAAMLKWMVKNNKISEDALHGFFVPETAAVIVPGNLPPKGKVGVDALNIRGGAGKTFETVGEPLSRGKDVEILEEKQGWYRVKTTIEGWVNKDFINT